MMTVDEAKLLNKGDYVFYNRLKYKVLNTKECRHAHTNEMFISIKCRRKNEIIWLTNEFVEVRYEFDRL